MINPEQFLADHPDTETVDILLPDLNGLFRGKQIPASKLTTLFNGSVMIPRATVLLDTLGHSSVNIPFGFQDGDPDRHLLPVPGTLVPVSWQQRPAAQLMTLVADDGNSPWFANPATVLASCKNVFAEFSLRPVIAIELEFHLLKPDKSQPAPARAGENWPDFTGPQTYNLDQLADYSAFLLQVQRCCEEQGIALASTLTEFGEGQFEINLTHTEDVLSACNQAMMLRRVVRQVAIQHQYLATFMAKPLADNCGNGMHVHLSLLDQEGRNVFDSGTDQPCTEMQNAIAGLLELMPESMALFAPNANAYRRFDLDSFAPAYADWGLDHRAVAVRVPRAVSGNQRIEHRVAGADANPYLVVAAILAGVAHGLKTRPVLPEPTTGTGCTDKSASLPQRWHSALATFNNGAVLQEYLGSEFCSLYHTVKSDEESHYHSQQHSLDYLHYLRSI